MFGLFKKKPDDLVLFLWISSAVAMEYGSFSKENRAFSIENIEKTVYQTADYKSCKLTSEQVKKLKVSCIAIWDGVISEPDNEFVSIVKKLTANFNKKVFDKEPAIQLGEMLQRYGVFWGA